MKRTTITTFMLTRADVEEAIKEWLKRGEGVEINAIDFKIKDGGDYGSSVFIGAICQREHGKDE